MWLVVCFRRSPLGELGWAPDDEADIVSIKKGRNGLSGERGTRASSGKPHTRGDRWGRRRKNEQNTIFRSPARKWFRERTEFI